MEGDKEEKIFGKYFTRYFIFNKDGSSTEKFSVI